MCTAIPDRAARKSAASDIKNVPRLRRYEPRSKRLEVTADRGPRNEKQPGILPAADIVLWKVSLCRRWTQAIHGLQSGVEKIKLLRGRPRKDREPGPTAPGRAVEINSCVNDCNDEKTGWRGVRIRPWHVNSWVQPAARRHRRTSRSAAVRPFERESTHSPGGDRSPEGRGTRPTTSRRGRRLFPIDPCGRLTESKEIP